MANMKGRIAAWLDRHLAGRTRATPDDEEYAAWLSRHYEPIAGGWQY